MYRLGKSSGSHAFKDAAHESAVIILVCTFIFQRSNSAKKSCGEGRSSLYRSTKSVSCWAVIWLSWITDGTNPSSLLTLTGYHAYQVGYAYRSGEFWTKLSIYLKASTRGWYNCKVCVTNRNSPVVSWWLSSPCCGPSISKWRSIICSQNNPTIEDIFLTGVPYLTNGVSKDERRGIRSLSIRPS